MPKTYVDFRFDERDAARYLPAGVGRRLGDSVRRVDVPIDDPLFKRIGEVERARPGHFFNSFSIRRRYTRAELDQAEALVWLISAVFEQAGELHGTVYDSSTACGLCRAGRTQRSDLILDLAAVPKKDIAISISGEIVISDRFAEAIAREALSGTVLRRVRDTARRRRKPVAQRHQLVAAPPPISILSPPATFGVDPFDPDEEGTYRCPLGHVVGLNRLSEVTVARDRWPARDLVATREQTGNPNWIGHLYPEPILLISPRMYRLIEGERFTGSRVEVAHLA